MLRKFAPLFAATFIFGAASQAHAASSDGFGGGGVDHGLHMAARSGPSRSGSLGTRVRGYTMSRRVSTTGSGAGHESGWYHRGFGGTLGPGWGYGFGAKLGSH
jgi:hypothetical protein